MSGLEFKSPVFLLLLVPLAAAAFFYYYKKLFARELTVGISSKRIIRRKANLRSRAYPYLSVLRFAALVLIVLALARPGKGVDYTPISNMGIDIMIALDVSASMMGEDFQPKNRLNVAKEVMTDFVKRRDADRIGMVIFAGEAYLQCPLTLEKSILNEILEQIDFSSVAEEGTAIGEAITLAASRMTDSQAKSKIILLITDGVNNKGSIDPETAAKACNELGIKVYTVGIGKEGSVPYPSQGMFLGKRYIENQFDSESLEKIAAITGAKFYRAESGGVLWENIRDIDRLEKSRYEVKVYHEFYDRFQYPLIAAGFLFMLEIMLKAFVFRKIP